MPTLQVFLPQGHTEPVKAALLAGLTQATIDAISAPAEAIRIMIDELPRLHIGVAGAASPVGAPLPSPAITAILIAGRTNQQKSALIEMLTAASVTALDCDGAGVRIFIKDIPNTDFGLAGRTAKSMGR